MTTIAIRCDVTVDANEANVYRISCGLGPEPTEEQIAAATADMQRVLGEEMARRSDTPSAPPVGFAWLLNKTWRAHIFAVGQYPKEVP